MVKNRILSICTLIVCLVMYMETFKFGEKTSVQVVSPAAYPRFLLYFIAGFSIFILIQSFFTKTDKNQAIVFNFKKFWNKYREIILLFLFFGFYVFLLSSNVGFIISTLLFMFASQALLMGLKRLKSVITNISVTTVLTFFVYFTFTEMLSIMLP
ncbi:tripartite tricarboxylate transporter TctB family protein [Virgibacillus sp. C22-A2]|uniref:Tripartite tricarboxylate transporter TctB family protein n=1 Tax=Virgibacillus tibetensis TaxID=3042313 RepID=A0ABU6KDR6_9BACI|nr:tripartite tricarboxylate transporter TctB family protein [Virgibacillus sp. C22-A2]